MRLPYVADWFWSGCALLLAAGWRALRFRPGTAGSLCGSCGLLSAGPAFFQRAGFACENGFDALQVLDVEPADGIVVVYRLNFFGTNALNKALFKCLLRAVPITVAIDALGCGIVKVESQMRGSSTGAVVAAVHGSAKLLLWYPGSETVSGAPG